MKILLSGNEAIAQGAIQAGCSFYAGYPITPQNEIIAYMAKHMPKKGVFIQAESELAAINMVYGASAAGVRAMTSSSSPGISLKQEGISYIAGAQLPAVIVNIMRGGPGLGNIAPAQSDYFQATRGGGHGDYHLIVLAPACVQEAYDLTQTGFDLADKYRIPVMILGDGILGQMMEPVEIRRQKTENRKQKQPIKPWALTGCKGRKPNIVKSFFLREGALEEFNLKLQKNYEIIRQKEARFEGLFLSDAKVILVAYGTMARIAKSAIFELRKEGYKIGLIRPISLWPFPVNAFRHPSIVNRHPSFLVIEMSYGQMLEDVRLAVGGRQQVEFFGRSGGGVPTEGQIMNKVKKILS
ncbi:MAG: 3-methyl-2-oxobutanoate dehydrogenase subunit VorB [Candidatus Omnitrophica bacterium]|nr:3-methyl-2-oxobutanoate dehydrogenase subunit VorB [Candidatus Omnitrophota bacterium]MBU4303058.1 3-methyl-2-oxobutanoate dehydrogenase subunit VorB [Candidatus Omnitrophota bacterium]MBU4468162.1 3-methyl-2-oxobutanoate dehydrogenase subunit VorB [Candidatus Omnitrophota bacterium]MCG2707357.1 3-methyl-2-oxobutanoate dehydrogenase subunit VorB [Candidatus Omnitrophota bacterium]